MPGKSSTLRTELAAQNRSLMALFEAAGHEFIEPEIIQPADVFLERAGEDLRSRTYVFTDPDGTELCLRPDLTVPTCSYRLARATNPGDEARYCYCGPAFRHHPASSGLPREFEHLGLEWFGAEDAEQAESKVFNLAIAAIEQAGLKNYTIRLGDLGLFRALLSAIEMPERWRRRLAHEFWRPMEFHNLLGDLTGQRKPVETSTRRLAQKLAGQANADAISFVEAELALNDWALVPGRSLADIAGRLEEKAADIQSPPLARQSAELINSYLDCHGNLKTASEKLARMTTPGNDAFSSALQKMNRRHGLLETGTSDKNNISFAAEFGRSLEYYTGFVFQIEVEDESGAPVVIAGGGRYDSLLSDIGKCEPVRAVGCAIYGERLLSAVKSGGHSA